MDLGYCFLIICEQTCFFVFVYTIYTIFQMAHFYHFLILYGKYCFYKIFDMVHKSFAVVQLILIASASALTSNFLLTVLKSRSLSQRYKVALFEIFNFAVAFNYPCNGRCLHAPYAYKTVVAVLNSKISCCVNTHKPVGSFTAKCRSIKALYSVCYTLIVADDLIVIG